MGRVTLLTILVRDSLTPVEVASEKSKLHDSLLWESDPTGTGMCDWVSQ